MHILDQASHSRIRERVKGNYFFYDLGGIAAHLRTLEAPGVRLWYACKANPLSAVVRTVHEAGFSFDVASPGELAQVVRYGVSGEKILLTGPSKPRDFLRQALAAGVSTFVLESRRQWDELALLAEENGADVDVLLRAQLDWGDSAASVLGGNTVTAFGLELCEWKDLPPSARLRVRGAHVFQWGNILDEARLTQIWGSIAEQVRAFFRSERLPLEILDLGGGLGISYDGQNRRADWTRLAPFLSELRSGFELQEIWLELGRYAVGPYGTYASTVVDRKRTRGKDLLVLSGGVNHLLRPVLVNESFPCAMIRESSAKPREFQVHGPLCTSLDRLGVFSLPEDIAPGDTLAFSQAGAYGFTESMPYFLCHELPAEVILRNGEIEVLRANEGAESWLR